MKRVNDQNSVKSQVNTLGRLAVAAVDSTSLSCLSSPGSRKIPYGTTPWFSPTNQTPCYEEHINPMYIYPFESVATGFST